MAKGYLTFPVAYRRFDKAYWRVLAQCPKATSFRAAATLAGVAVSVVHRRFQQYGLRLKYGRR